MFQEFLQIQMRGGGWFSRSSGSHPDLLQESGPNNGAERRTRRLVSITAELLTPTLGVATLIGGVGGLIVVFAVPMLDKMKIDDVVGAIPVHLIAGIWGTLAVPLTNSDANFGTQIISIAIVGAFTFVISWIVWTIINLVLGIRVSEEEELEGLDKAELGMESYPDFSKQI